jgi:hypothetical protein
VFVFVLQISLFDVHAGVPLSSAHWQFSSPRVQPGGAGVTPVCFSHFCVPWLQTNPDARHVPPVAQPQFSKPRVQPATTGAGVVEARDVNDWPSGTQMLPSHTCTESTHVFAALQGQLSVPGWHVARWHLLVSALHTSAPWHLPSAWHAHVSRPSSHVRHRPLMQARLASLHTAPVLQTQLAVPGEHVGTGGAAETHVPAAHVRPLSQKVPWHGQLRQPRLGKQRPLRHCADATHDVPSQRQ